MFPKAAVWQLLRQQALSAVPERTFVSYQSPPTIEDWIGKGTYSVKSASTNSFILEAAAADVGSALISDASFYADHAVEHAVSLRNQLASERWNSPAWMAVTFYYWSYHAVVGLTRLFGRTVMFLSANDASFLQQLGPGGGSRTGSGPYNLTCGPMLSATQREVELRRSRQTRAHDAIWRLWFAELRAWVAISGAARSSDLEARLYLTIVLTANLLGDTWPSELRNILNYNLGVGYGAVRRNIQCSAYGLIDVKSPPLTLEVIEQFEADAAGLRRGVPLSEQLSGATKALVGLSFVLDLLLINLLGEVSDRRNIDRRWINARNAFRRAQALPFGTVGWPASDQ